MAERRLAQLVQLVAELVRVHQVAPLQDFFPVTQFLNGPAHPVGEAGIGEGLQDFFPLAHVLSGPTRPVGESGSGEGLNTSGDTCERVEAS